MKPFPLRKQEKIIIATAAPHNCIRNYGKNEEFDKCDRNPNYTLQNQEERSIDEEMSSSTRKRVLDDGYMTRVCNQIIVALMENKNR